MTTTRGADLVAVNPAALAPRRPAEKAAELLADWTASLTPATRRAYVADLGAFARFLHVDDARAAAVELCGAEPLDARDLVLRWRTAMRDGGAAPASINRHLATVRSFYKHAMGAPLIVKGEKGARRRPVHRQNGGTVSLLLAAAAEPGGLRALRDVALLLTVHDSGLRRAEAASLRVGDLDLAERRALVIGKGRGGEREGVDLSAPAADALARYLVARGTLDPVAPVFVAVDRARTARAVKALTPEGIRLILSGLSRRAGLAHAVAPHDLRRMGATALARGGVDAEGLRRWGRWADYRTPARYVADSPEKGRAAVDALAAMRAAV